MGGGYAWLAELRTITCTLTNCKGDSDSYAGEADDSLETDSELRNMKKQVFFFLEEFSLFLEVSTFHGVSRCMVKFLRPSKV